MPCLWAELDAQGHQMMVHKGFCPGLSIWSVVDRQMERPISMKPAVGLIYNGHPIHYTHRLKWYRGVLYCAKCGAYSITRVRKLRNVCLLKPHPTMRRVLNNFKDGVFLFPGGDWPMPEGTLPAQLVLRGHDEIAGMGWD